MKFLFHSKKYSRIETLVSKQDDFRVTDSEVEALSVQLRSLPKNSVPRGERAYRFQNHASRFSVWSRKLVWGLSPVTALVLCVGIVQASEKALPGSALYSVKRAKENIQVSLSSSPEKRAETQIAHTKRRIEEVNILLSTPGSDAKVTATALLDTSNSTKDTIEQVKTVVKTKALAEKDESLLNQLSNLSAEQSALAAKLTASNSSDPAIKSTSNVQQQNSTEVKNATESVVEITKQTEGAVKELHVFVSAVHDQELTALNKKEDSAKKPEPTEVTKKSDTPTVTKAASVKSSSSTFQADSVENSLTTDGKTDTIDRDGEIKSSLIIEDPSPQAPAKPK